MKFSTAVHIAMLLSVLAGANAAGCNCRDSETNEIDSDTTTQCCGQVEGVLNPAGTNCVVLAAGLQSLFRVCCEVDGEVGSCI